MRHDRSWRRPAGPPASDYGGQPSRRLSTASDSGPLIKCGPRRWLPERPIKVGVGERAQNVDAKLSFPAAR